MAERIPIPSISKFPDHPGESVASIGDWMFLFDRYIMVCNSCRTTALTSAEKNSLLFMYLGTEGCRIMKSNPALREIDTGTYGNFRDAVIRQFSRDKSVVRAQFEFQNRNQEQSESITEYIHLSSQESCGGLFFRRQTRRKNSPATRCGILESYRKNELSQNAHARPGRYHQHP